MSVTQKCLWCGKPGFISKKSKDSDFDKNPFFSNGFNPICRKCKNNIEDLETFKTYLQDSRIEFSEATWKKASEEVRETLLKQYKGKELPEDFTKTSFKKIMHRFFSLGNLSGDYKFMPLNTEIDYIEKNVKKNKKETVKLDKNTHIDLVRKWGNLPKNELVFLETEWADWCNRYDVSTKSMELLVKEICYQQLVIKKKREKGESVSKELKDLQDLMNSSALKPIQESAAMSADFNTLGTWIKKFENERPIPEPDPELQDVDGFKKYIRIWFLGHLCKMLGINNEYVKEYEEEMIKYTVDIDLNKEFNVYLDENDVIEEMDDV